ncbi:MAG: flavodoxin-dependent (E)-4-hydroxy-3-methylbut-2-enyl-diphosphate synthase, partial [Eubacterium sp.]
MPEPLPAENTNSAIGLGLILSQGIGAHTIRVSLTGNPVERGPNQLIFILRTLGLSRRLEQKLSPGLTCGRTKSIDRSDSPIRWQPWWLIS